MQRADDAPRSLLDPALKLDEADDVRQPTGRDRSAATKTLRGWITEAFGSQKYRPV